MDPRLMRFDGFEGIHLVGDVWGREGDGRCCSCTGAARPATRGEHGRGARAKRGQAVSLDLRGHGDSEWALNGDYSFTAYSADCLAVIDRLGRPPVLVGASLGGVTALLAEGGVGPRGLERPRHRGHHPSHEPRGDPANPGVHGLRGGGLRHSRGGGRRHRGLHPEPAEARESGRAHEGPAPAADGRWYWHWDPRFLEGGRTEVPRAGFEALFDAALANIQVPTLLVRGALSDVVTEEGVQEFLRRIPGAKLAEVGGASHMVAGDQNDAFSRAVIEFLERDIRPALPR